MSCAQDRSQLKQRNAMVTEANNKLQTQLAESERQEQEHRSHSNKLSTRIDDLNAELTAARTESETARAQVAAEAKARTEAELREIFHMADQDCNGFIGAEELLALGQAVDRNFTQQKCRDLIHRMDSNHDGKVSPDEFVELVCKVMEGLSEVSKKKMRAKYRAAAERIAREVKAKAEQEHRSQVVELNKRLKEQVSVLQEHIETLKRQGDEGLAAHAKTKEDWHVQRIQQEQYVLELQAQAREHTKELQESALKLEQCEREVQELKRQLMAAHNETEVPLAPQHRHI